MALLTSAVSVQAQLPNFNPPENADIDITLELLSDARCHVTISAVAQFEMEDLGNIPITNGNVDLEISSPSSGQLTLDVTGSATFTETALDEETLMMLAMVNVDLINSELSPVEGKYLSEILGVDAELFPMVADIEIESIRCTTFSWSEPTLEAGMTTTLSGSVFENEELRDKLPIELTLGINLTAEDNIMVMELTLDLYFKLPVVDGQVQWSPKLPEMENIPWLENLNLENLGELLRQYNIDFTLKVPSDASVSGLPSNYSQEDNDTYTWSSDNAADALDMLLTGGVQPDITYGYEAPSSPPSEFPWLVVGVLVVVVVVAVVAVVALRARK